mgnify:CR=1 FL=1
MHMSPVVVDAWTCRQVRQDVMHLQLHVSTPTMVALKVGGCDGSAPAFRATVGSRDGQGVACRGGGCVKAPCVCEEMICGFPWQFCRWRQVAFLHDDAGMPVASRC